ncbi:hypothetical protein [Streptomyces sp. TLI_105]|uniref:hypothetical protein n=1 Tax=Streptomyces sp. TLI_105 TaxID=1881019 RepID=UPI00115F8BA2|nr:hypothetical protein [Streptomyces sp. TLI_105]
MTAEAAAAAARLRWRRTRRRMRSIRSALVMTHDEAVSASAGRRVHIRVGRLGHEVARGRRPRLGSARGSRRGRRRDRPRRDPRDLWSEALAGVLARPVSSARTILGTVLGIGTLVITSGAASTANQIVGRFDALTATSVSVVVPVRPPGSPRPALVPWTGPEAVARLTGI